MTVNILEKNGAFQFQEALEKMGWDTEKFEAELEIYAKTQKPKMAERIRKEYNRFMSDCGWPLELVAVDECDGIRIRIPKVKPKPKPPITPQIEAVPEIKPDLTPEPKIAVEAAEQKIENPPETVPQTPPVLEPEKISETPKEEPKTETAKTNINASATAYFTFPNANLFKKLYESMCVLVPEITWKISKDGISMRQMDPSRVAMIDLTINKEEFQEFHVETPGLVTFSAEEIKKIVFKKPLKKDTRLAIKIDGKIGRIAFTVIGKNNKERTFPTLEASEEKVPSPKITFNAKYKVTTKQLTEDIADLIDISDHMTLIGTPETLQLKAENDVTKGETTYKRGDDNLLDLEVREESKAVYSLSYLKNIIKPLPALNELTILEFATDMPIKITNLTKFGELKFFIAPRIETD